MITLGMIFFSYSVAVKVQTFRIYQLQLVYVGLFVCFYRCLFSDFALFGLFFFDVV